MKRILFILITILLTQTLNAQTTLAEGFESWPPSGWEIFTQGPSTRTWRQDFEGIFHTGNHSADSNISNELMNNWLVSSAINIANANYELKYWEIHESPEFYNMSAVYVSTGSSDPSSGDYVQVYEANTLNTATWQERIIDLSAYNGQTIYVAFRHQGTYHQWFIDDVSVSPSSFVDGAITEFLSPLGVSETPIAAPIILRVENFGTTVINNFNITWDVNSVPQPTYNATALNLQPGQNITINIGTFDFNTEGSYDINANLNLFEDFDSSNNQLENTFDISSFKDGALIGITPEGMIPNSGSLEVKATISNLGNNTINIAEILWSVNGVDQTPYTSNILNLATGESTTLTIGQFNFTTGVQTINASLNVVGDINETNDHYESFVAYDTFIESFEGNVFPPEGWSINFGTRDGIDFDTPVDGEYYYVSNSDNNYFGVVTDTIYTPLLDIENGDRFRFYIKTSPPTQANHTLVWKNGVTGEVNTIQTIANSPGLNTWALRDIDISAAIGVNYIGIVTTSGGYGESKFDLFTSDASLYLFDNDLKILNGDMYFLAKQNESQNFECKIRNAGTLPVSGASYSVKLMEAPNTELATVGGVDLNSWEDAIIALNYTFTTIENKRLFFKIDYTLDENISNNTFREANVSVVPNTVEINDIGTPDLPTSSIPFSPNGNTNTLGEDDLSQMLFYKDEFSSAGNVYGVAYKYDNILQADKVVHYPVKVWIAQSDIDNLDGGWVTNSELTLVYDGVVEILPGYNRDLYIPFDQPILLNGIDNLVVQVYQYDPEWPPSIFRFFAKNLNSGPTRTILVNDVFDLDAINPPDFYASVPTFSFTRFVIDPVLSNSILSGVVYDNTTSNPIQNATVTLEGSAISTQTDINGNYTLPQLPYGNYNITASFNGFQDNTLAINLNSANQIQDFYLNPLNEVQVTGTVFGSNDISTPLELADVTLTQNGTTIEAVVTNSNGDFVFPTVYGGLNYEITVFMYGYEAYTISISPGETNIDLGDIILEQEFISPFDVMVNTNDSPTVVWKSPKLSQKVKLQQDLNQISNSYTNEPNENVWLGNYFLINQTTTLTSVEIVTDVYSNAVDFVTIDIFNLSTNEIIASSEPFLIQQDSIQTIDIPNIVVYNNIAVMVHWQDNPLSTNSLAIDYSDSNIINSALIKYPDTSLTLLSDFFGEGFPNMSFLIRINTLDDGTPVTNTESLFYNVYRGLASDFPNVSNWDLINTTPLSNLTYIDTDGTGIDPNENYRYAVEAVYTNGLSEVTYSNPISGELLSITDFETLNSEVTVFPVPTSDYLTIKMGPNLQISRPMEVYDILGKQVLTIAPAEIDNGYVIKNVTSLQSGMYFLKIDFSGTIVNKKFIVD